MNYSKSLTSWQSASSWYNNLVSNKGHYYHQKIIIPKTLGLMNLNKTSQILDLGCGQGILERQIPPNIYYLGIDASKDLIKIAQKNKVSNNHHFQTADVTQPLAISKYDFTHCLIILALQNFKNPQAVFINASKHLIQGGKLLMIINHPCFRIPKNSSWGIDKKNKIQYRRIDKYLSVLKNLVTVNPGLKDKSPRLLTYHYPLSGYIKMLNQTGYVILQIEEWPSDKISIGKNSQMENIARFEIPLFMALVAQKII